MIVPLNRQNNFEFILLLSCSGAYTENIWNCPWKQAECVLFCHLQWEKGKNTAQILRVVKTFLPSGKYDLISSLSEFRGHIDHSLIILLTLGILIVEITYVMVFKTIWYVQYLFTYIWNKNQFCKLSFVNVQFWFNQNKTYETNLKTFYVH